MDTNSDITPFDYFHNIALTFPSVLTKKLYNLQG